MQTTVTTLLAQALHQEQQRHAAALASIDARKDDIATVDRLVRALRARSWRAEGLIETHPYGSGAACSLVLLLSCSEGELFDVMEFLAADGVSVSRRVTGDVGCSREYRLRLDRCTVRMNAYVHVKSREAA